jgi:hypothetical protein
MMDRRGMMVRPLVTVAAHYLRKGNSPLSVPTAGTVAGRAVMAVALGLLGLLGLAAPAAPLAQAASSITVISQACGGQNSEVEEATAAPSYIYQVWIGCGGIGYSRSTNGGASYSTAVEMPGSGGAWDPAIAVGPTGNVYVAYMLNSGGYEYPVVSASFDQGATFTQTTGLRPSSSGNWGDRDFIAVGPDGTIYVTWDYGPDASKVTLLCSSGGSCAYSTGDLNAVVQKSTDGGKTFGKITPIGPGYPTMGGYSAPVLVTPGGQIDSLYWGHQTDPSTYALQPGYEYFTDSTDGGTTWSASPQQLYPAEGSIALPTWWIDGDLAIDSGGTLYATWDTQTAAGDIGYLTYSSDGGTTWSTPVRVTPDTDSAMHNVEVVGGSPGTAYVAWQTSAPSQGYATYLQTFSTSTGLVGTPSQVSASNGNRSVWPGDTFGLATLPGGQIALSWGSANGTSSTAEIYATVVSTTTTADFTISANPTSGAVTQGSPATTAVATTAIGGDTEAVNLSASGLPAGVTATFNPASVIPGGSSALTLSTSSTTPAGSYPITITGSGTSNTHATTYTLTVTASTGSSVPPAPTGLTAGTNVKKHWITLNWSESQSGVTFNVYRSTSATMPSSPTYTGISPKSFTDKNVTAGATYYFWVTAVNSTGQSPPCGPLTATA